MRVGIDATCWANERGYGRFTRHIVTAMVALAPDTEFVCFLDDESAARFDLAAANVRRVTVHLSASASRAASATGNRSLRDMLRMSRSVNREKLDCFFSPSVYTYFPLPIGLPALVTIHDAIAERFPHLTLPSRRARLFWKMKVWLALRQADTVLTVSDHAARDIARVHRIPAHRIAVALEAPAGEYLVETPDHEATAMAARSGIPAGQSWFTYVGGFNPHKNIPGIIRAHAALAVEMGPRAPHIALVGTLDRDVFHGDVAAIRAAIAQSNTSELVHWTGFVNDPDLAKLHAGALALLLPSECEGFGLPAVEAAACGTPVIATTESPLPELLAGGGIFVTPGDERQLLDAMRRIASEPSLRSELGAAARKRARALTWELGAESCLAALRSVAGGRSGR